MSNDNTSILSNELRRLEMTERRQAESLAKTQAAVKLIKELIASTTKK